MNRQEYKKQYRKTHAELISNDRSQRHRRDRISLIDFLGHKCKNCGENDIDVLVFDHINNDGREEKRRLHNTQIPEYYLNHLKEAKKKLQLLCHNCNWKKERIYRELIRLIGIKVPPF